MTLRKEQERDSIDFFSCTSFASPSFEGKSLTFATKRTTSCDLSDLTDQRRSDSFSARRLGGYGIDRASRLSCVRRVNQRREETRFRRGNERCGGEERFDLAKQRAERIDACDIRRCVVSFLRFNDGKTFFSLGLTSRTNGILKK